MKKYNDGNRGLSLMPVFPDLIPDEITTYDQLSAYAGDVVDLVAPFNFDGDVYDHTLGVYEDSSSLSDSGYRIAFTATSDGSDSELYLYRFGSYQYSSFPEPDQISVTVTTYDPEIELEETDPYISPDGCLLVFTAVNPDGPEIGGSSVYALDIRDASGTLDDPVLVGNFAYGTTVRYEPTVTNVDPDDGEFAVTFSANCNDGSSAPDGEVNRIYQMQGDMDDADYGIDQQTNPDPLDISNLGTTLRTPVLFPDEYLYPLTPAFLGLVWNSGHDEVCFVRWSYTGGISWWILTNLNTQFQLISFYDSKPWPSGLIDPDEGDDYCHVVFRNGLDTSGSIQLVKITFLNPPELDCWNISGGLFDLFAAYEDNPHISYDGRVIVFESYKNNASDIYLGYDFVDDDDDEFTSIARLTFDGGYTLPRATKLIDYEID